MEVKYFCAKWCGPCKMYKPEFERVATEKAASASFSVVDIDDNADEAQKFGIRGVPTLVVVDDAGNETGRAVGVAKIKELIATV